MEFKLKELDIDVKSLALSLCLQLYFHSTLDDALFVLSCARCCKLLRKYVLDGDEAFWRRLLRQHLGEVLASTLLSREITQPAWMTFVTCLHGALNPYSVAGVTGNEERLRGMRSNAVVMPRPDLLATIRGSSACMYKSYVELDLLFIYLLILLRLFK
jgi:hypothetical protein